VRIQNPQLKELFRTPKRKTYTAIAITIILVGFLSFFSIRPTFVKIADLNKEIKDKENFKEKVDEKLRTVNSLIAQKQSVSEELLYFEQAFPEDHSSGYIVANIAAIAKSYNLDLMGIEFNEIKGEDYKTSYIDQEKIDIETITTVEVNLSVEGNLTDIEKYVGRLEEFPRILDVQSISISSMSLNEYREDIVDFRPIQGRIVLMFYLWNSDGASK
jgi:Tfp pilus assembly protein PilO